MIWRQSARSWKHARALRRWAAAGAVLLLAAGVLFAALQAARPAPDVLRRGQGVLTTDYALSYKPNSIYDKAKPGDKEAVLLSYVDHVTFQYAYALKGFDGLPVDYDWSVEARLIGRSSESNNYVDSDTVLWRKDYALAPLQQQTGGSASAGVSGKVDVNVGQFTDFAKNVYEQSQVRTTNEVRLLFHVTATVHGPLEDAVDSNTVELVLPMIDNVLVITGAPSTANALSMRVAQPAPQRSLLPWAILCCLLSLLMAAAALALTPARKPDAAMAFAKTTSRIFKQYGERLVRMENPLPYQHLATIPIDGVAEMVKIADEISQPVFYYLVDQAGEKKIEFYVFDSGRIYYMVLFGQMGLVNARVV